MAATSARGPLRNAALILFGLGLGLCVLEVGLQAAALFLRGVEGDSAVAWLGLGRRVVCLGDSNTYGLYLTDRQQAYPQQLERLWNTTVDAPQVEVLNLGYPGTNSSRLRRDLPRMLETFRPDMVIVMVGSNDYWTAPVPVDDVLPPGSGLVHSLGSSCVHFLARHSRVYQLVYMLRRAFDQRRLEVVRDVRADGGRAGFLRYGDSEFAMGFTPAARGFEHRRELLENLRAIAASIRAWGAVPLFMTYPSRQSNYGEAGHFLRAVAAETETRLVDLGAVFAPVCPQEPCPTWLYADHHPTARGYQLIAETLVQSLRDVL